MTKGTDVADCGCETATTGADGAVRRGPVRAQLAGMAFGLLVPAIVGAASAAIDDSEPGAAGAHGAMSGMDMDMSASITWLGTAEWYYGAMAVMLAAGALHAVVRSGGRSCGSTPFGMGIMWGAMFAMALGMAAGIH